MIGPFLTPNEPTGLRAALDGEATSLWYRRLGQSFMALANVGLVLALLVDLLSGVGGQELFLLGQALLVGGFSVLAAPPRCCRGNDHCADRGHLVVSLVLVRPEFLARNGGGGSADPSRRNGDLRLQRPARSRAGPGDLRRHPVFQRHYSRPNRKPWSSPCCSGHAPPSPPASGSSCGWRRPSGIAWQTKLAAQSGWRWPENSTTLWPTT